MGSLGRVQGLVFGAAPGIENPFPADPLPRVGLGLLPAAVNLPEREGTAVQPGNRAATAYVGTGRFYSQNPEFLFPLICTLLKPSPIYL